MKGKFVSVAPAKTNRAEFDVTRLRGAENFFVPRAVSRIARLTGESQPDVTLDCFTKLVDGNFQTVLRQTLFDLLLD